MSQEDEGSSSDNKDQNQSFLFDRLIFDRYWNHVEVGSRNLRSSCINIDDENEPIVPKSVGSLLDYVNKKSDMSISKQDTLKECIQKVRDSIEEIRKLYYEQFYDRRGYTDDKLAQMMVMDGCFILQFINKLSKSGDVLHINRLHSRVNKENSWLMDISFKPSSRKPIFRMSKVLIDSYFEVVMRNLIAYEQYSSPIGNYVTSYAMAMYMLVATPADIVS
ncbi:hypothetical protein E3N88_08561 [Mikania micrantha]|uniref:Uncharacterized protein n=1 Tax=Mikania micrantha TaxID=192012 RepID=A0A5N6PJN4_9ASTR|nr:hypothetical protein E3N88_08561 [Mikania micrantha]